MARKGKLKARRKTGHRDPKRKYFPELRDKDGEFRPFVARGQRRKGDWARKVVKA